MRPPKAEFAEKLFPFGARRKRACKQPFARLGRFYARERLMRILPACISLIFLAGCATVVRGTEQDVSVDTAPSGARVEFSDGQSCTSPCSISARRNQALEVIISRQGCTPQTAFIRPRITALGGILGGLPDLATGAVYDLEPSSLSYTLTCAEAADSR
jgi:hypothetical protein